MKVTWTEESQLQIEAIVTYVAKDNVSAAFTLAETIIDTVESMLPDNPKAGRPGRVDGTRELVVHRSYLVAYRVTATTVEVLTVRHAARLWPKHF
jgi:addiction module RelE/StbE family toxin